jgi:outer membrane protein assembly factor BamB
LAVLASGAFRKPAAHPATRPHDIIGQPQPVHFGPNSAAARRKVMRLAACLALLALFITSVVAAPQWPSFRGPRSSGVAAEAQPPQQWNVASRTNVRWQTPIPGLGHSSPVVSGNRVFLTTAVSSSAAAQALKLGDSDAAGIDPADDLVPHAWQVLAIDRTTGKAAWTRTVHQGVPRVKRHVKSSHASATPATDGRVLVALLGSEGLFAFDLDGQPLWRRDLGVLAVGLADEPEYEWGPASSPVIHGDVVVVQNDRYKDSHLIAFDLHTGKELWRSNREELPAWSTPLIHDTPQGPMVIVNSPRFFRAHDLRTGRERWRVADPEGQVKVSSPVAAGDLAILTGGWPSAARPIQAVRISDGGIVWRHDRGSPYTTTPLVYDGLVYIVTDNGILSAYRAADGSRVYQQRVAVDAGGFSASPVAAAGRIYLTSEDGKIYVVRAGPSYELLAANDMGEVCMATPAPVEDVLLVRTRTRLYALGAAR